jgi:hypothetical protein
MSAGERENCENFMVEAESTPCVEAESVACVGTESVASVAESFADVVKIMSFPMGPGAASVARGLQSEPDMEARTRRLLRRGPAYQYA